jgi:hypothetical protein
VRILPKELDREELTWAVNSMAWSSTGYEAAHRCYTQAPFRSIEYRCLVGRLSDEFTVGNLTGRDPLQSAVVLACTRNPRVLTQSPSRQGDGQMRRSRFSKRQIIAILRELESWAATRDVCRRHGISDAVLYKGKANYVSVAKRLKGL